MSALSRSRSCGITTLVLLVLGSHLNAQVSELKAPLATVYRAGTVVGGIEDIDGDGRADVLLGDPDAMGGAGEVRLFSSASGTEIYLLQGLAGAFGSTLLVTSDLDGDGIGDIAVGAPTHGQTPTGSNGGVQVFSGATGTLLYTVYATATLRAFGHSLAEVGDIDGDGISELAIGAPAEITFTSYWSFPVLTGVTVVSGASGAVVLTLTSSAFPPDGFGAAVTGPGDLDGDSIPDIAVGVPRGSSGFALPPTLQTQPRPGEVRVYSGASGGLIKTWTGASASGLFGSSLACVGDVDADGVGDVVVAATRAAVPGTPVLGRLDMISGQSGSIIWSHAGGGTGWSLTLGENLAATGDMDGDGVGEILVSRSHGITFGFPPDVPGEVRLLSGVSGSALHTFSGALGEVHFGHALAGIGDVDLDGVPDVVVGDAKAYDSGQVYVLSGATFGVIAGISGNPAWDTFGFSLAAAGDLDGDQITDILVGAPGMNRNGILDGGSVFAFSGVSGSLITTIPGTTTNEALGYALDGGSDVNGDGVPDILVGAPDPLLGHPPLTSGKAVVYSGATASPLLTFTGAQLESRLGFAVAFLGDVDGDGVDDIILGEPGGSSLTSAGLVRVHSGASGALLYTHAGAASGDYMGFAVARLGDVDGDFVDDFLAGAPQGAIPGRFDVPSFGLAGLHPAGVGYVDVCSGATGSVIRTHTGTGIRQDFGREVTGTPDLDGDGVADYAVGAPYTGPWAGGYVKVYSGATGTVLFTLSKATTGAYERFGAAISAGGDVDGDGTPDLAIGAPGRYGNWGRVEIWSGATGQLLESRNSPATPPQALVGPRGEHYGNALAWLGDLDGDGTDELAVGAPYPWVEFESIGRVEVISPLVPPSPFPRPTWFGSGCPVSSIPLHPSISVSETPQSAGSPNFSVLLDIAPPLSQATLIIGFSNTSWLGNALPLSLAPAGAPGCQLLVSADATVSATTAPVHAWSRSSVSLPIPPTPSLAGAVVYFQWYVTDPGFVSGVAGSGVSAGLMVTIH